MTSHSSTSDVQAAAGSTARRVLLAFLAAALVVATLATVSAKPASAVYSSRYSTVATCEGYKYFLIENGTLDCSMDADNWETVGSTGQALNALAYDSLGGTLVAIKINTNRLYRVALDGTATFVGNVTNLPSSSTIVTGGDIDPATGTYYVNTADNRFFSINLATRVATELTSSLPFNLGADIVVEGGRVWSINNDTGSSNQYLEGFKLSDFSALSTSMSVSDTGPAGAQWSDIAGGGDGIVWFSNSGSRTYKSSGLSSGGTTPTVIGEDLAFSIPIDGATYWSLVPINGTPTRGNSQVQITWDPSPTIDPNAVYLYEVKAYDPQGNYAGSCTYSTATDSGNTCTITGLTNGTPYTFTITATNQSNGQQTSGSFGPATPATTPSVPLNVTATDGNGSITVGWDSSASNGGEPIDSYTATAYDGDGNALGSCTYTVGATPSNTCTITGLTNGTTYTVKVTAHNVIGSGPPGSPSSSLTLPTTPSAPNNPSATVDVGSATVSWTVPDSDGGADIDSYTATAYDADGNPVGSCTYTGNDPTGTMSCEITGLSNGTTYTFKVTAHNKVGNGPASASAGPYTTPDVPSAPNDVNVTTDPGSATITWTDPDSNGGSDIDSYTVTAYDGDGNPVGSCTYTVGDSPVNQCTIDGLSDGTPYTFEVTAHNSVGDGPASSSFGPISTPDVPGAPNDVSVDTSPGGATISWTIPDSDGGSDIDGYTVEAYDADGNLAGSCTYSGNNPTGTMSCEITGLSNNTPYTFKVKAHNGVGNGPWSSPAGPFDTPTTPSAPNNVNLSGGLTQGSATISWTIPDTDGGADIDGYTVEAYDADGNLAGSCTYSGNNPTGTMSCEIAGLTLGSKYTFKVKAHNGVGFGPWSSPAGPFLISSWNCAAGEQIAMVNGTFYRTTDFGTWSTLSAGNETVNAIAYNSNDGFAYGLVQKGARKAQLSRISGTGAVTTLGRISGLPKAIYLAGSIDQATGYYYVSSQNQHLWRIDLAAKTATEAYVPGDMPRFGADLVVKNGVVWTINTTKLFSYDLNQGATSSWWLPKGQRNLKVGGMTFDVNGRLVLMSNQNGNIYRVTGLNNRTVTVTNVGDFTAGVPSGVDVDLTACATS